MANKKKEVYRPKPMTEGKKAVIQGLLDEYDIQSAEDIQDALKDLLSGTIQTMLETEMNEHLGYEKYARDDDSFHDPVEMAICGVKSITICHEIVITLSRLPSLVVTKRTAPDSRYVNARLRFPFFISMHSYRS